MQYYSIYWPDLSSHVYCFSGECSVKFCCICSFSKLYSKQSLCLCQSEHVFVFFFFVWLFLINQCRWCKSSCSKTGFMRSGKTSIFKDSQETSGDVLKICRCLIDNSTLCAHAKTSKPAVICSEDTNYVQY